MTSKIRTFCASILNSIVDAPRLCRRLSRRSTRLIFEPRTLGYVRAPVPNVNGFRATRMVAAPAGGWKTAIAAKPSSTTQIPTVTAIPSLMILLSTTLPARVNRTINLVVASLYIPVSAFNAVGESWTYFYGLSIGLEVLLLAFILRSAWTWPRRTASPATRTTSLNTEPHRTPQQA